MRPFLSTMLLIAVVTTAFVTTARAMEPRTRPNVIFILADDWGWGDLGCYGHRYIRTPNLDRLAADGTLFTQFYVCSGVCSPSRAAFMTGQFPARLGIHGHLSTPQQNARRGMPDYLDPKVTTLPRLLQKAGYATAHFGKWHLGSGPDAPPPSAYGFDIFRCVNGPGPAWKSGDPYFRARSTELIIDETITFIDNHRDEPFFVQSWLLLTHATLHPTDEQMEPYKRFGPAGVPYRGAAQIYYASATDADTQIGRLMQRLDELGLTENTIVIFSSDNGPEDIHIRNASHSGIGSAGPFRGRKRSLYEGGVRVPFIVRWPAVTSAGRVDDANVINATDFLPTFCRIAGAEVPEGTPLDGEDLSAAFRGERVQRDQPLFWDWRYRIWGHIWHHSPRLAMRDGDWKLLMNPDRSRMELYHIPKDPTELDNLADRKPEIVQRMAERLMAWHAELPESPVEDVAGSNAYPWPGR